MRQLLDQVFFIFSKFYFQRKFFQLPWQTFY